jgi:hypothetical protein
MKPILLIGHGGGAHFLRPGLLAHGRVPLQRDLLATVLGRGTQGRSIATMRPAKTMYRSCVVSRD